MKVCIATENPELNQIIESVFANYIPKENVSSYIDQIQHPELSKLDANIYVISGHDEIIDQLKKQKNNPKIFYITNNKRLQT